MALEIVGSNSAAGTTVTIPAHVAGDLIVMFAYRSGNTTAPSMPAGWNNVHNAGANTNSARLAWIEASGSGTTSGTWTNANHLQVVVFRGHAGIGGYGTAGSTSSTVSYPAISGVNAAGTSRIVSFAGHRTSTTLNTPTDMTNLGVQGPSPISARHISSTPVSSWFAKNVTASANSGWRAYSLEILEYVPPPPASGKWTDKTIDLTLSLDGYTISTPYDGEMAKGDQEQTTGKFYLSHTLTTKPTEFDFFIGFGTAGFTINSSGIYPGNGGTATTAFGFYGSDNPAYYIQANGGQAVSWPLTPVAGDVIDMAVDLGAKLLWVRINNGNWNNNGSANPATGVGGASFSNYVGGATRPLASLFSYVGTTIAVTTNFGASAFTNPAPAGFTPWFSGEIVVEEPTRLFKVWGGSAWDLKPIKVWDGQEWTIYPAKFWNGNAWVTEGTIVAPPTTNIVTNGFVLDGDSLTAGDGSTGGQNYPNQLATLSGLGVTNRGVSGKYLQAMDTNFNTWAAPYYNSTNRNTYVILGGANELLDELATNTNLIAWLQSICTKAKAIFDKVIICTIPPSEDYIPAMESIRLLVNTWILNNYAIYAHAVADLAAIPQFNPPGADAEFSDGVHFTNQGYGRIAGVVYNASLANIITAVSFTELTAGMTASNGNLTVSSTIDGAKARANVGYSTGKRFFSVTTTSLSSDYNSAVGLSNTAFILSEGGSYMTTESFALDANSDGFYALLINGNFINVPGIPTVGDVRDFAVDLDAKLVWVRINGGAWNGDPVAGTGGQSFSAYVGGTVFYPTVDLHNYASGSNSVTANFGATSFPYAPPTGYSAWAA